MSDRLGLLRPRPALTQIRNRNKEFGFSERARRTAELTRAPEPPRERVVPGRRPWGFCGGAFVDNGIVKSLHHSCRRLSYRTIHMF